MILAQRVSVQFVLILRQWLVVGDVAAMAGRNASVGILTSASERGNWSRRDQGLRGAQDKVKVET